MVRSWWRDWREEALDWVVEAIQEMSEGERDDSGMSFLKATTFPVDLAVCMARSWAAFLMYSGRVRMVDVCSVSVGFGLAM